MQYEIKPWLTCVPVLIVAMLIIPCLLSHVARYFKSRRPYFPQASENTAREWNVSHNIFHSDEC